MTRRSIGIYLFHIAESFRNVIEYTAEIDILIHQYFGIDIETVWRITEREAQVSLSAIVQLEEYKSAAAVYA